MAGVPYGRKGAGRVRSSEETKERSRAAFNLWRRGDYITLDCPATLYLQARGIGWLAHKQFRNVLRWMPDARHPSGLRLPAIFAAITDTNEAFRAVHRIFLKPDRPEKFGPPASYGPIAGHAVKLATLQQAMTAGDLIVGEGVETTAAACALLKLPGWSAIACGNLSSALVLPLEIRRVTIAVDRDVAGETAARAAAKRWRLE